MKRTFWDFFKNEYEVRLSVGGHDAVAPSADQCFGISAVQENGTAPDGAGISDEAAAFIRALKPGVIRFSATGPDQAYWLDFCRSEEICPHLLFDAGETLAEIESAVRQCTEKITKDDLWEPRRFYEICRSDRIPDSSGDPEQIEAMRAAAERIRALDPEARIILGGISPIGENSERSAKWNIPLMEKCADIMDMLGVTLQPEVPAGRIWDPENEGVEAGAAMAEQMRLGIERLETQIFQAAPDQKIRIALTGWSGLQDDTPQKRQDCTYYGAVYRTIRMACRSVALNEAGPLFGPDGLLSCENGTVFANVFCLNMLTAAYDQGTALWMNELDSKKPVPAFHWEGLPNTLDETEIRMLEAFASCSEDGKKLYLLLINRSPFKQALARIGFYDLPLMSPLAACSIRSGNRLDENSAAFPEKIFCKQIRLRKYREMDHVTLEIPPCGCAWLLLE